MHDSNDKWVRRFTTDSTSKHKSGFTIYKITSYLFPLASPEAVTVVSVWKRYSELQKLQRNMKKMHQELYLKGVCPGFTKWGYFRRFDAETIEDRMKCTQALLEFIALHPPLFTSTEFVKFFQSSYAEPGIDAQTNSPSNIEAIRSSLLLPVEVIGPLEYQSSEDDSFSTVDSPNVSTMDNLDTSHQRNNSTHSNSSRHSASNYPRHSLTSTESTGTVENVADILMLHDPIQALSPLAMLAPAPAPMNVSQISNSDETNIEDRLAMNTSKKINLPDLISFDLKTNMDISQISTDSSGDSLSFLDSLTNSVNLTSSATKTAEKNKEASVEIGLGMAETDLDVSLTQSVASFLDKNNVADNSASKIDMRCVKNTELNSKPVAGSDNGNFDKANSSKNNIDSVSPRTLARSGSRMDTVSMDSIFGSSSDLKEESYVFEAGYLLSLGARHEAKGDYQKAFDFYKAGIEKMLIGAQDDTNDFRKQFVKDKTNKYLSYAEKIYANYLNNPTSELLLDSMSHSEIALPRDRPKTLVRHCDASSMCRPYEDLAKYRVLGIIGGQVMLVLCSETQQCYAMKVIQKTCNQVSDDDYFKRPNIDNKLPIMPIDIPYMVKLIAYIETPNLLFLVLQYASGGKLFDYIKNYVKSIPDTPARQVNLENVFIGAEEIQNSTKTSKDNSKMCRDTVEWIEFNKNLTENHLKEEQNDKNANKQSNSNSEQIDKNNDMSVTEIVINSQRLLLNVDNALSGQYLKDKSVGGEVDCGVVSEVDEVSDKSEVDVEGDRLGLMVSEVERTFDGLKEKLEQIIMDEDGSNFNILPNRSALPPKSLCNWASELLIAIDHLHQCGVICRNLNPNNLLLGERGHLMLSYMVGRETQLALVPLLHEGRLLRDCCVAPELQRFPLLDEAYNERVGDFWSFGAILYELIIGMPLSLAHPSGFNSHTILNMPKDLPADAESLLSQLLCFDPRERLGSGSTGIMEIKSHPYFKHVDWDMLEEDYKYDSK